MKIKFFDWRLVCANSYSKKVMGKILSVLCVMMIWGAAVAQELNCNVHIDIEQVATQETQIFQNMESALADFINDRRWTDDEFEPEERIECDIYITIESSKSNNTYFEANAQIQSNRPVYGTEYSSPVFNFLDRDFNFSYNQGTRLTFNDNSFNDDLSAYLAFYAYIILGYDYDTFSEMGGTKYFEKAQNIVLNAPSNASPGWQETNGPNNRFELSDQLNNPQFDDFRKGLYNYHRKALDNLTDQPVEGQELILGMLEDIQEIKQKVTTSIVLKSFFKAKQNELVKIFKGAEREMKTKALEALNKTDPTNSDKYQEIMSLR